MKMKKDEKLLENVISEFDQMLDDHNDRLAAQDENEKLDFETVYCFIAMRRAVTHHPDDLCTLTQFVGRYRRELDATKRVLEWLGLARADDAAPLGWTPTVRLVYWLVQGPIEDETTAYTMKETKFMKGLYCLALGEMPSKKTIVFINKQLTQFGLAESDNGDRCKATFGLKRIADRVMRERHSTALT
jgi:hypothetical protein